MTEQDSPPPTITAIKIPIIKKGEYDIWSMRMRQYICHTDHNLWDIIVDGDLQEEVAPAGEQSGPPAPKTAKQLTAKRNQERAAIKSRFGGNDESKKMQRNVLKHQFENFTTAPNESLDKAYDRFQKLISQLEVHAAPVSKEDINQKFLRSLPPSWSQITLIMRNKPDIDQTGIDDLYNNLRVYEDDLIDQDDLEELDIRWQVAMLTIRVKWHFAKECKSGRNQGKRSYGDNDRRNATTNEPSSQELVARDVNYALMAISSSSSSSSSDNDVQNCSKQCLESFKILQKNFDREREKHSRARLEIQGYELALESIESRILGHEKNEMAWDENEFQNYELNQMSAKDKNGLGYGTQMDEISNKSKSDSEISISVFEVRSSNEELTPANDRFSKADGYHAVPPPITGNFLTPRADISFVGLDEYAIRKKIIESKTDTSKSKTSETVGKTNEVNIEKPKSVHESVVKD
ncbi:hypothetical protein Tco_0000922 [Tanacetum coccineum]